MSYLQATSMKLIIFLCMCAIKAKETGEIWSDDSPFYQYRLVKSNVTWDQAVQECAAIGAILPVPRMASEYVMLTDLLGDISSPISSFAVGIKLAPNSYLLLDTHQSSPMGQFDKCLSQESPTAGPKIALYANGYRKIDSTYITNAVCQLYKDTVDIDTLPCTSLNVTPTGSCSGACDLATTSKGGFRGFVLLYPVPNMTVPIANINSTRLHLNLNHISTGQYPINSVTSGVSVDIFGYALKSKNSTTRPVRPISLVDGLVQKALDPKNPAYIFDPSFDECSALLNDMTDGFDCDTSTDATQTEMPISAAVSDNENMWSQSDLYTYRLAKKNVTWSQAIQECAAIGATIPIPRMASEYEHLITRLNNNQNDITSFAVGIRKSKEKRKYNLLDNNETIDCLDVVPGYEGKSLLALHTDGYRTMDDPETTNAVCQEYRSIVDITSLPCSPLDLHTFKDCGNKKSCNTVFASSSTKGAMYGFVLPSSIPGTTTPIANLNFANSKISRTTFSLSEIQSVVKTGATVDIVGHAFKDKKNTPVKTWQIYLSKAGSGTKLGLTKKNSTGTTFTILRCAGDCCKKFANITNGFGCKTKKTSKSASTGTQLQVETTDSTFSETTPGSVVLQISVNWNVGPEVLTIDTGSTFPETALENAEGEDLMSKELTESTSTVTSTISPLITDSEESLEHHTDAVVSQSELESTTEILPDLNSVMVDSQTQPDVFLNQSSHDQAAQKSIYAPASQENERPSNPLEASITKEQFGDPMLYHDYVTRTVIAVLNELGCCSIISTATASILLAVCRKDFSLESILHMNQEISLAIAHITMLTTSSWTSSAIASTICNLTAMLLQWLFFVYFTFLLLEGLHIYLILKSVILRGGIFKCYQATLAGWLIPAFLTAGSAAAAFNDYRSPRTYACWLNWDNSMVARLSCLPIISLAWISVILAEAAAQGNTAGAIDSDPHQRLAAKVNQKGVATMTLLTISAWMVTSIAVHEGMVSLYIISFGLHMAMAVTIFFFHIFGVPKSWALLVSLWKKVKSRKIKQGTKTIAN